MAQSFVLSIPETPNKSSLFYHHPCSTCSFNVIHGQLARKTLWKGDNMEALTRHISEAVLTYCNIQLCYTLPAYTCEICHI